MTKKKQYKVVNRTEVSTTLANDLNEKLVSLSMDTGIAKTKLLDQAVSLLLLFQSNSTKYFIGELNEIKEKKGLIVVNWQNIS
ncbi:ribbon-helix-helix domain-containing protein [Bacillus sp. AFS059628]|uniref:ribbon-helix-helix domain-containing protein n=1 Tax=Bacillus sp. AFS059628 TaxID=2033508 RepID=UPI00211D5C61|nr:ribbon-helix-helix domain-containing protein [Bacillus sp. AFS059628]